MEKKNLKKKSIIVKCASDMFLPLAATFGCYVVFHGSSSPGGGFQGGVLIASALLLVFLGYGAKGVKKYFNEHKIHSSETVAELIYVIIALIGVFAGLNFCVNFVFDGKFLETSMLMNDAVGYHVMAGIMFLLILMLNAMTDDDEEPAEAVEAVEAAEVAETAEADGKEALE